MAGMYSMQDLLNLVARQRAQELLLQAGCPPMMVLEGQKRLLDAPSVSSEDVNDLFQSIASPEQQRELELCGTATFRYEAEHLAQFSVTAALQGRNLNLRIKNLGR